MTAPTRTPANDGEVLFHPGMAAVREMIGRPFPDVPIDGSVTLGSLRRSLASSLNQLVHHGRETVPRDAEGGIIIVGGHQPHPFHPGVWAKNFALSAIARRLGGAALHVVVDSDAANVPAIRLPTADGLKHFPLVEAADSRPFETIPAPDPAKLTVLGERILAETRKWTFATGFESAWCEIVRSAACGSSLSECLSSPRRSAERQLGIFNAEVTIGRLADSREFGRFLHGILRRSAEFRTMHNGAVINYRKVHKLRSRTHPVPELWADGDRIEVPLWYWDRENPQRRPVYVRTDGPYGEFIVDGVVKRRLPMGSAFADHWAESDGRSTWFRPRAVLLTLFLRMVVGTMMVHGIGGARYDQVTDQLMKRFYGIEPPGYAVVSATCRLPFAPAPFTRDEMTDLRMLPRRIYWQPERYLPRTPENLARSAAKKAIEELPVSTRAERRRRFQEFRALHAEMVVSAEPLIASARRSRLAAEEENGMAQIRCSREYDWYLHPQERMESLCRTVQAVVTESDG